MCEQLIKKSCEENEYALDRRSREQLNGENTARAPAPNGSQSCRMKGSIFRVFRAGAAAVIWAKSITGSISGVLDE
jgi:hypothetical protein